MYLRKCEKNQFDAYNSLAIHVISFTVTVIYQEANNGDIFKWLIIPLFIE